MTSYNNKQQLSSSNKSQIGGSLTLDTLFFRRQSSSNASTSPTTTSANAMFNPRVQLIPHTRTSSHDGSFSDVEREHLDNTWFDSKDLSSKDFDFEDVFTYDKPQKKLNRVVEVTAPSRDWSSFTFSHYSSATVLRHKANRSSKPSASEMYLRNQSDARRR